MPWPTTNGMRNLVGAEADLIRAAIGMMVDTHVSETRGHAESWAYGIDWFDQWDVGQRLWLLERVTLAFFGSETLVSPAAIFDAAADAIFFELEDLVQMEISEARSTVADRSWRQSVVDAFACQHGRLPEIGPETIDARRWHRTITRIGDSILGIRLYQRAEAFRDADYARTRAFLRDRGLPDDYLIRIPPLRSDDQIQISVDRIQAYVFA